VESDQDGALPLTTGVASMRLNDELKLTRESRQGNAGMQLRPVRVYYQRKSLIGDEGEREADYELDIRPQGGGEMQRGAHVVLARQQDGTWRVSRFSESQPR
jgi:ketosteroid isomerase-like protein